jgi:hypothetical protein
MFLYHGTSELRLRHILEEDCLRASTVNIPRVCMSSKYEPALYWANMSAWTDSSSPFVIRLKAEDLLDNMYALTPYSDPFHGEGQCDWEYEVSICEDIFPLREVMKDFKEVLWTEVRNRCPPSVLMWA